MKTYIQPFTEEVKLPADMLMADVNQGSDAQKDWSGDAPARQSSGEFFPL